MNNAVKISDTTIEGKARLTRLEHTVQIKSAFTTLSPPSPNDSDCILDGDSEVRIAIYLRQTGGDLIIRDNEIRHFNHWAVLEMSGSQHYHPFPYDSIRFEGNWVHHNSKLPPPI